MSTINNRGGYGQTRTIRFDLAKSIYDEIEEIAAEENETFHAVIHRAIRNELDRRRAPVSVATTDTDAEKQLVKKLERARQARSARALARAAVT